MTDPLSLSVNITENLQQIHHKIEEICQQYQRDPEKIQLLAVSKTKPDQAIRQAYAAGQRHFGENYLQEALQKISALADLNIEWHFIGAIQSNKTREIASHFDWAHSVDRLKIAQRLNDQRPAHLPPLNICLQVNVDAEASKSGVHIEQLGQLVESIIPLPQVRLRGLMAIPAASDDFETQRSAFSRMRIAFEKLQRTHPQLDTLSMGMSNDMAAAIAEGSTLLRIGTAIFGQRKT